MTNRARQKYIQSGGRRSKGAEVFDKSIRVRKADCIDGWYLPFAGATANCRCVGVGLSERSHNDEYITKELRPMMFRPAMETRQPRLRCERVEFQRHPPGLLVGVNNRDWLSFVLDEVVDHFNRAADRLLYEVECRLLVHCDAQDPAVRFDRDDIGQFTFLS